PGGGRRARERQTKGQHDRGTGGYGPTTRLVLAGGKCGADDVAYRRKALFLDVSGKALDHPKRRKRVGERGGADLHRGRTGHEELERILRARDTARADD